MGQLSYMRADFETERTYFTVKADVEHAMRADVCNYLTIVTPSGTGSSTLMMARLPQRDMRLLEGL